MSAVAEHAPPDCGICQRTLLVGESLALFHDTRADRVVKVCELCRARAHTRGLEPAELAERPRLRVQPSGDVADAPEIETAPFSQLADKVVPVDDALAELTRQVEERDRQIADLRIAADPGRRREEARAIVRMNEELRELREEVLDRDARIERLQQARTAETSPMRMCGVALEAFNQSRPVERMARIARTLGDPVVNVHDEGPGIPRRVRLTLSWDIAWYEFVVKLDLGVGRASVHETGTGGDPRDLPVERRRSNARWRDSGLVLG